MDGLPILTPDSSIILLHSSCSLAGLLRDLDDSDDNDDNDVNVM